MALIFFKDESFSDVFRHFTQDLRFKKLTEFQGKISKKENHTWIHHCQTAENKRQGAKSYGGGGGGGEGSNFYKVATVLTHS